MNSQIYNILEVIEEIKLLIKDSQYKTTLDDLIQIIITIIIMLYQMKHQQQKEILK